MPIYFSLSLSNRIRHNQINLIETKPQKEAFTSLCASPRKHTAATRTQATGTAPKLENKGNTNSCVPFVRIEVNLTIPAGTKGTMLMLRVEFALRCSAASQPCQPAYDAATFDASTSSDLSTLLQILHRVPTDQEKSDKGIAADGRSSKS
ncbi:uncharacterized protein UDID_19909 [Ustilago sp. UG-2017a]|nr:uncharacterized protein UDID_19909 [Ustilago sp. UG-2017a]